jgi:hypothetical protein
VLHQVRAHLGQHRGVVFGVSGHTGLRQHRVQGLHGVGAARERLREQHVGAAQIESEALELQVGHGRAHRGHQPGGVGVVEEARESQLDGVAMRAALPAGLEYTHREPRLRQVGGGGEAVDPAADHDHVVVPHPRPSS